MIEFACQNVTEGPMTDALKAADIILLQEANEKLSRAGLRLPDGHRHAYCPGPVNADMIAWDDRVYQVDKRDYIPFHRSGQAEGWHPTIKSPARGMPWTKGTLVKSDIRLAVGCVHLLNSWYPINPDQWTDERRKIVVRDCLPKIKAAIDRWHKQGYTVVIGGDFNSLRWNGELPQMTPIHDHGLDRSWRSTEGELRLTDRPSEGPKTGVGGQMQHNSILWTMEPKR